MLALKRLRGQRELSQKKLSELLGVTRQAVSAWETGKAAPDPEMLLRLAEVFGVSVDELLGGSGPNSMSRFPIIGEVAAGYNGGEAREIYTGESVEIPTSWLRGLPPEEYYVLRATGSSMYPDIQNGDLLLVRRTNQVDSGRIAIVIQGDGSGTVKRIEYSISGAYVDLVPRNPEYETKRITGPAINDLMIQGEVRKIIRDI